MSTLAKINPNKKKSKKAMSVVIGYVLILTFAAVIGVIVYKWQKTYVPTDEYASCPEGASLFIINKSYDCFSNTLTFAIKNNGQFAIGGYFIYLKDNESKQIATVDISRNITDSPDPRLYNLSINGIKLGMKGSPSLNLNNSFAPGEMEIEVFLLPAIEDKIYAIEIVPIRWQNESRRLVIASCRNEKITEVFSGCSTACIPDETAVTCAGRVCGTVMNNCYQNVNCDNPGCGIGEFCNSTGQCVVTEDCTETCTGRNCGSACEVPCGTCTLPEICDYDTGQCGTGGGGIPQSCPAVCADLGYIGNPQPGHCEQNQAQCNDYCTNGVLESSGDVWCAGGPTDNCCCCLPQS